MIKSKVRISNMNEIREKKLMELGWRKDHFKVGLFYKEGHEYNFITKEFIGNNEVLPIYFVDTLEKLIYEYNTRCLRFGMKVLHLPTGICSVFKHYGGGRECSIVLLDKSDYSLDMAKYRLENFPSTKVNIVDLKIGWQ